MEIYMDNAATTRVYPEVVQLMNKIMEEDYGNPSSLHMKAEQNPITWRLSEGHWRIREQAGI